MKVKNPRAFEKKQIQEGMKKLRTQCYVAYGPYDFAWGLDPRFVRLKVCIYAACLNEMDP